MRGPPRKALPRFGRNTESTHTLEIVVTTFQMNRGTASYSIARVIYYHFNSASKIALLMIYPKNEQQDLTGDQRKALKMIVEQWR